MDTKSGTLVGKYGKLSDEERRELVKKLDNDLDDFIEELSKRKEKKRKNSFNFDEWCKELDQHPAFMTDLKTNEDGEYSEAVQALQALKYDDSDVVDRQLEAERNREEGNKHFMFKKYRWAIDSYGNGIKQYCKDKKLNSKLFGNRAAANKRLGNYRSAFRDCYFARRFDSLNLKCVIVGAECLIQLRRGRECMKWLENSEKAYSDNFKRAEQSNDEIKQLEIIKSLKANASEIAEEEEREAENERRKLAEDVLAKRKLLAALAKRRVQFRPTIDFDDPFSFEWSQVEAQIFWLRESTRVSMDDNGVLSWPILVQFPELQKVNAVTDCCEESIVEDVFGAMFNSDEDKELWRNGVRMFISLDVDSDYDSALISPESTIQEVLSTKGFVITAGLPVVQAYTPEHAEKHFVHVRDNLYKTL